MWSWQERFVFVCDGAASRGVAGLRGQGTALQWRDTDRQERLGAATWGAVMVGLRMAECGSAGEVWTWRGEVRSARVGEVRSDEVTASSGGLGEAGVAGSGPAQCGGAVDGLKRTGEARLDRDQ